MKPQILLTCMALFLLVSCAKEKPPAPKAKTKTEMLTTHYWKMSAATIDPPLVVGGTPISDWYAQMDACEKDNIYKYNANGTTVADEGATKCDPADPQTELETWSFNSTETIITENGSDAKLLNLTDNELKMSLVENIDGINYTLTVTFVKN